MTKEAVRKFLKAASAFAMFAGGLAVVMCLPYLMVGATFRIIEVASLPFIGSAIVAGSGLVSYSVLHATETN